MGAWKGAPGETGIVADCLEEEVRARMERQKEVGRKKGRPLCREGSARSESCMVLVDNAALPGAADAEKIPDKDAELGGRRSSKPRRPG